MKTSIVIFLIAAILFLGVNSLPFSDKQTVMEMIEECVSKSPSDKGKTFEEFMNDCYIPWRNTGAQDDIGQFN